MPLQNNVKLVDLATYGISQQAINDLAKAKDIFHGIVLKYNFYDIPQTKYRVVQTEAIHFHLVGEARTRFSEYVRSRGGRVRFHRITRERQLRDTRYKDRKHAVYFGDISIDKNTKTRFIEHDIDTYISLINASVSELQLLLFLGDLGIPDQDAGGWLFDVAVGVSEIFVKNTADYKDRYPEKQKQITGKKRKKNNQRGDDQKKRRRIQ